MTLFRLPMIALLALMSTFAFSHGRLETLMKEMKEDYKLIQTEMARDISSPQLTGAASRMKLNSIEARGLEPHKISEIRDAAERARTFKAYQSIMDELIDEISTLERALIRRDATLATSSMGRIRDIQRRGHDLFE